MAVTGFARGSDEALPSNIYPENALEGTASSVPEWEDSAGGTPRPPSAASSCKAKRRLRFFLDTKASGYVTFSPALP